MVRGVAGVLFGVMLVVGFSRPHAKPPTPRRVQGVAFTCFSWPDAERQCIAAAPSAPDHRG